MQERRKPGKEQEHPFATANASSTTHPKSASPLLIGGANALAPSSLGGCAPCQREPRHANDSWRSGG